MPPQRKAEEKVETTNDNNVLFAALKFIAAMPRDKPTPIIAPKSVSRVDIGIPVPYVEIIVNNVA